MSPATNILNVPELQVLPCYLFLSVHHVCKILNIKYMYYGMYISLKMQK